MTSFKRTYSRSYATSVNTYNADSQYWKNYEFPITVKEYTSIDYIDVSKVEPYYISVSTGPKVDIYHQQTAQVWRSLTRFQKLAYGGKFRDDGQLLIAGSEEAKVKLFNFKQNQLLRIFSGHSGPVHRADFIRGKPQVVSFSDDKSICLWDIADEKEILTFNEHKDFIRGGMASPTSEHIIISGSYDHTVKVWDSRTGSSVMTFTHGCPVESVVCYPSGSVIASAGGTEVKIWDAIGGKLLTVLSQHHKTITCLTLATNNTRLLSGSLDRHVKVYDLNSYTTLHSMDYPASVLSLGVAPGDSTLVTGMLSSGSGLISFEQRSVTEKNKAVLDKPGAEFHKSQLKFQLKPGDEIVTHIEKREKLTRYDKMLSRFKFSLTLDGVTQSGISLKSPHITVAVLRELIRRGGLGVALAGRDAKSLNNIFRFLNRNIRIPAYSKILIEVTHTLLDIYGETVGENSKILSQFNRLNQELERDLLVSRSGIGLLGVIEMFLTSSSDKIPEARPLNSASNQNGHQ